MGSPLKIALLLTFVATAVLAARKGYSVMRWALASGILGLIALSFLPDVNPRRGRDEAELARLKAKGDSLGTTLSVMFVVLAALRYLHGR